jgi:hypothetical protein
MGRADQFAELDIAILRGQGSRNGRMSVDKLRVL